MSEDFSAYDLTLIVLAFSGLSLAAVLSLLYVRSKFKARKAIKRLLLENKYLKEDVAHTSLLLQKTESVHLLYEGQNAMPRISGNVEKLFKDILPARIPVFNTWLHPKEASHLERAVQDMRTNAQGFTCELVALSSQVFEAKGEIIGSLALVTLRPLEGARQETRLNSQKSETEAEQILNFETLFHTLPLPIWFRNQESKLTFVNKAFATALDTKDVSLVLEKNHELLDSSTRQAAKLKIQAQHNYSETVRAIAQGERRVYEVLETPLVGGSAGYALDKTREEAYKKEREQQVKAQRTIFDKLNIALAVFDAQRSLVFYNKACQLLWGLPTSFLDDSPNEGDVFDRLRDKGRLPEHPNHREWKRQFLELKADKTQEPREENWYMPDRTTLKVMQYQNELGGFSYMFEDVTQHHELERKHSSLSLLQRETIENLSEAVAVYHSDGRLSLFNEAFTKLWQLSESDYTASPHIETLHQKIKLSLQDAYPLEMLQGVVTGLVATREAYQATLALKNGKTLILTASPLPDGGTLTSTRDITHETQANRLLLERNQALQAANALKSALVKNVSYEMRSPLTTIIGFAQMLEMGALGALPPQQKEYLAYILRSSAQLETVIDSILDFAALETDKLALTLKPFDIKTTMLGAIEGIKGKRTQDNIKIILETPHNLGAMQGDEKRVRQVFIALLSNAIGFSRQNGEVLFRVERLAQALVFTIKDEGPGISPEKRGQILEAFTSFSEGTGHRGMGLGLSLAQSLIHLHGGQLDFPEHNGIGTIVTVRFPLKEVVSHAA